MMNIRQATKNHLLFKRWFFSILIAFLIFLIAPKAEAHPMPNSAVLLHIKDEGVAVELQLPLSELQLAFGYAVANPSTQVLQALRPQLMQYLAAHLHAVCSDGSTWQTTVQAIALGQSEQTETGPYQELIAHVWLAAPKGSSTRQFLLYYDVIMHTLATHAALVTIQSDWYGGVAEAPQQVGIISLDIVHNTIRPLQINAGEGSLFTGIKSMFMMGLKHIAAGTDHLLFLLVLLLPAPLLFTRKRWTGFGGIRYSISKLFTMVSAFTIGHSVTLLLAALDWVTLPQQPVEIFIAVSIIVAAVHAIVPLFAGNEMWIAGSFGLVHGLAFAASIINLKLQGSLLLVSILSFNLGIECMQLCIIVLVVPWLILLSVRTRLYRLLRIIGALLAALAAMAWILQQITGNRNVITALIERLLPYTLYGIACLAVAAIISYSKLSLYKSSKKVTSSL